MYLIRENSRDNPYILNVTETPSSEKNIILFHNYVHGAHWWINNGMPERNLIYWCRDTFISPEKIFLDIGSHIGTYSLICGAKAKQTYAFECNPTVFCYLAANLALHELCDRVIPMRYALGEVEDHTTYFVRSEEGGTNGIKKLSTADNNVPNFKVHVRSLDSFNIENIGFIKMDVEGAELDVFKGAKDTLIKSNYPPILFESWGENKTDVPAELRKNLFDYIQSIGYSVQQVTGAPDTFLATHP